MQSDLTARFKASALVDDIAFCLDGSSSLAEWSENSVSFVTNVPLGNGLFEYLFRNTNVVGSLPKGFVRLTAEQTP